MNYMLERPGVSAEPGKKPKYMENTFASNEKNKKSSMEKIYNRNNPFDRR